MKKYVLLTISNLFIFLFLPVLRLFNKNIYEKNILPKIINYTCNTNPVGHQRKKIIPNAFGVVLEIGSGSGLNFKYYNSEIVSKIIAIDPSIELTFLAEDEAKKHNLDIEFINKSAEKIPLPDNSIDSVVSTYTLCSIPLPYSTIHEIFRVLKSGGIFLFSEHGRSPDRFTSFLQDRIEFFYPLISGGCHCNRDILNIIKDANFRFQSFESSYLPGTQKFLGFNYWGSAIKP